MRNFNEIGQIIKKLRMEQKISLRKLGKLIGLGENNPYFRWLENGKVVKYPNYEAIINALRVLGLTDEQINDFIPLDEYYKKRNEWFEKRVGILSHQVNLLLIEYRKMLIEQIDLKNESQIMDIQIREDILDEYRMVKILENKGYDITKK